MATSLGTNAVVATRVHCKMLSGYTIGYCILQMLEYPFWLMQLMTRSVNKHGLLDTPVLGGGGRAMYWNLYLLQAECECWLLRAAQFVSRVSLSLFWRKLGKKIAAKVHHIQRDNNAFIKLQQLAGNSPSSHSHKFCPKLFFFCSLKFFTQIPYLT